MMTKFFFERTKYSFLTFVTLLINICFVSNSRNHCLAFQQSSSSSATITTVLGRKGPPLLAHQYQQEPKQNNEISLNFTRRSVLSVAAAATLPLFANGYAAAATTSSVAPIGGATQSARVESWPGIESMEPLYELKLSLDAIVDGVKDPKNWPYIQKRLEKFFGGFVINEKNYYMGVGVRITTTNKTGINLCPTCGFFSLIPILSINFVFSSLLFLRRLFTNLPQLQYTNEIKYDKNELPSYVLLDKQTRFDALEQTMKILENLKLVLSGSGTNAETVEDLAKSSQRSLQSFFAMIPEQDVKAVEELFNHVKKADTNGDGRLTDDEIIFLSPAEQEIWKRKVDKFG